MQRVVQVFIGADLRGQHPSLTKLCRKNGIDVTTLLPGHYVIFINSKRNRLKVFAANNVLAYLKMPEGQYLDMRTIQYIPQAFTASGNIDYNKALKETVEKALARKVRVSPLDAQRAAKTRGSAQQSSRI